MRESVKSILKVFFFVAAGVIVGAILKQNSVG